MTVPSEYMMRNARLDEAQAGIKIAGRNNNNLWYSDDITLMAESEEELQSLLMKVKEENEKVSLKLNIQKMKIMASGPITSCQIDGKIMETVRDFIFGSAKITAVGDCCHGIKQHLPLWRKAMTNLDSILKIRDITLPIKVHLVKAIVFPVVTYGYESWTIKKAECRRIDTFELMLLVLEKTLESPLDFKEIKPVKPKRNWSWIFIGRTDANVETPSNAKNWLISKDPDVGKDWRQKEKGRTDDEMVGLQHWLDWHEFEQGSGIGDGQVSLVLQSMGSQRVRHNWPTGLNWTEPGAYYEPGTS